jgi:hypothetical protein
MFEACRLFDITCLYHKCFGFETSLSFSSGAVYAGFGLAQQHVWRNGFAIVENFTSRILIALMEGTSVYRFFDEAVEFVLRYMSTL